MRPQVPVQISALRKHLVTQLADKALVEVLLHVHLQVGGHTEPFVAHRAGVWFLPTVTHHVVPAQ